MSNEKGFFCAYCRVFVPEGPEIGTKNRNHCPICLSSKHVDNQPGDRKATCQAQMEPIGLTFKQGLKQGELMLIHACIGCQKVSINRIAGDDDVEAIQAQFVKCLAMSPELKMSLEKEGIKVLGKEDEDEVKKQLFGVKLS